MRQTMNRTTEERMEGKAGKLYVRSWQPEIDLHGVVAICPGFNAHSGMYEWAGRKLARFGLAVMAVDLRGRGRSEGPRFYVESFDDYVEDLRALVFLAKERFPDRPIFLLGHSAGGVVACLYALDYGNEIAGLICESFAFKLPAPGFALAAIKALASIAPRARSISLNNRDFSRDPAVVASMIADPLIKKETQPASTIVALIRANDRLSRRFLEIDLPLLIIHGGKDKLTNPAGSDTFYRRTGSGDKTLKLYEGRFHDPLNDLGKEEVMSDIIAWIEARL